MSLNDLNKFERFEQVYRLNMSCLPGDAIHDGDIINLFTDPDGYVRYSETPLSPNQTFYPALPEITIGPVRYGQNSNLCVMT